MAERSTAARPARLAAMASDASHERGARRFAIMMLNAMGDPRGRTIEAP